MVPAQILRRSNLLDPRQILFALNGTTPSYLAIRQRSPFQPHNFPENCNATHLVTKLGVQIGVDTASNILTDTHSTMSRLVIFSWSRI
jgi:hypothetical protein